MRTVATIEARMTSSRLPGKVLMTAGGKPLLQILVERLQRARSLDAVVIATTVNATDDPIAALAASIGVDVFRGSEDDVLGRVCGALEQARAAVCVEITGDCPLVDPAIVDYAVDEFQRTYPEHQYVSTVAPVPAGLDAQVFRADALYALRDGNPDALDREHVSYGFYREEGRARWNPRWVAPQWCEGGDGLLMTLDYPEDYELLRRAHEELSVSSPAYGAPELIAWVHAHPALEAACVERRSQART